MKYLLGIALGLLLLFAPVAKADGFNPADVFPGESVFDLTLREQAPGFPAVDVHYSVEVLDTSAQGADFWGFCSYAGQNNLFRQLPNGTLEAAPYCSTDEPIQAFEPAGASFDIATAVFGFDPGLNPPYAVTTPEPSTGGLLVAGCFLCAFVALCRRMA